MNPLLLLPPEKAHKLGLWALKKGFGPRSCHNDPALNTTIFGKTFQNPIGLAAGADKRAESLKGWAQMGFGFVEAGTVTVNPRPGNPAKRLWRLGDSKSIINWMGLPGLGIEDFTQNLKRFNAAPDRQKLCIGASIASPDGVMDEFKHLTEQCAPLVDFITVNPSCPNVAYAENNDPVQSIKEQLEIVIAAAQGLPVMLKLAPTKDADYIKRLVAETMETGIAGFVATNCVNHGARTLLEGGEKIDWPQRNDQPVGGYSGYKLLPISKWMIQELRKNTGKDAVIMGVGGVQSGADARILIEAGANAVQLYTGLVYKGAGLITDIKKELIKIQKSA